MLVERSVNKAIDSIQQRLTRYACDLKFDDLSPEALHTAKARIIDNLGALIGGFFGEPCCIARNIACQMPDSAGATVIGTRIKTTPDMAAFVNVTAARHLELTDTYHGPGSSHGHPSETIPSLLAAAEHGQASGREFITGVVLAYEIFLRISDVFHNQAFDYTNFVCLGSAVGAGKLLGLSADQLAHCISMAVVPNNILRQARMGRSSMFKTVVCGHAGRAGVFAALLARAGMEGPHLPFEGKAGWCDHVAKERFSLDVMGGDGTPFKILETLIKTRSSAGGTISSILAAEKIAPLSNFREIKRVTVETYRHAKEGNGVGEHYWLPDSKESADHSIPYVVAVTFVDGTVTPRSFGHAHLRNPELRALMQKIEVLENEEFTRANESLPVEHRTRITVMMNDGERLVGMAGGDQGDLSSQKSDAQIENKFRGLTEEFLGAKRVSAILDLLWHMEDLGNVAEIPPAFVLD